LQGHNGCFALVLHARQAKFRPALLALLSVDGIAIDDQGVDLADIACHVFPAFPEVLLSDVLRDFALIGSNEFWRKQAVDAADMEVGDNEDAFDFSGH